MIKSAVSMASGSIQIEFIIFVDNDDTSNYSELNENIKLIRGDRKNNTLRYNIAANFAIGDILMYAADDLVFMSNNWDLILLNLITQNKKPCQLICPSDNTSYSGKIATHGFVTRELLNTLGYFFPPIFSDSYVDTWLTEITKRSNCFYFAPEIILYHDHYRQANNSLIFDELNLIRNKSNIMNAPELTFRKMYREREKDSLKIAMRNSEDLSLNFKYVLGVTCAKFLRLTSENPYWFRLRTSTNTDVLRIIFRRLITLVKQKIQRLFVSESWKKFDN